MHISLSGLLVKGPDKTKGYNKSTLPMTGTNEYSIWRGEKERIAKKTVHGIIPCFFNFRMSKITLALGKMGGVICGTLFDQWKCAAVC
jgi:hypothetical protein